MMPEEDFTKLSVKISEGSASAEEKLLFLKEMNEAMEDLHKEISKK